MDAGSVFWDSWGSHTYGEGGQQVGLEERSWAPGRQGTMFLWSRAQTPHCDLVAAGAGPPGGARAGGMT